MRWLREKQYKRDIAGDKGILRWLDPYFGDKYLDEINRDLIDEVAAIKLETVTPGGDHLREAANRISVTICHKKLKVEY